MLSFVDVIYNNKLIRIRVKNEIRIYFSFHAQSELNSDFSIEGINFE